MSLEPKDIINILQTLFFLGPHCKLRILVFFRSNSISKRYVAPRRSKKGFLQVHILRHSLFSPQFSVDSRRRKIKSYNLSNTKFFKIRESNEELILLISFLKKLKQNRRILIVLMEVLYTMSGAHWVMGS